MVHIVKKKVARRYLSFINFIFDASQDQETDKSWMLIEHLESFGPKINETIYCIPVMYGMKK